MIPTNEMKRCNDGFIWDPDAWRKNREEQKRLEEEDRANIKQETEYERAVAVWHLRLIMEKRFGHRPWMDGAPDPALLKWDENGNRVRPAAKRTLIHINPKPKQKRSLR